MRSMSITDVSEVPCRPLFVVLSGGGGGCCSHRDDITCRIVQRLLTSICSMPSISLSSSADQGGSLCWYKAKMAGTVGCPAACASRIAPNLQSAGWATSSGKKPKASEKRQTPSDQTSAASAK